MGTGIGRPFRKDLDAAGEARLVDGWKNPNVTITALKDRFRLQPHDISNLKREHGPKAKPAPLSDFWRQDRVRRHRRGLA